MIHLYYHGGSSNHGCEAIVRSTAKLLNCPVKLWSTSPDEDIKYGIHNVIDVFPDKYESVKKGGLLYIRCALEHKLLGTDYGFAKAGHRFFLNSIQPGDICLSIGGDNYCYAGVEDLGYYNRMIKGKGAKTVLWGCSIDSSVLTQPVIEDLKRYDLITVRESFSYEGLINAGINKNVVLCADPAFQLEYDNLDFPKGYSHKNTIGINVSPLVVEKSALVLENYIVLLRYILEETRFNVLLIPHVVKEETDDRLIMKQLLDQFRWNERIKLVDDCNCMKLKGYISQCRFFIGARTHATIAAYSTCVPTIVAGYSVKAIGIAHDLFGTDRGYVLPVQTLRTTDVLKDDFCWLVKNEEKIKRYLQEQMPSYKKRVFRAKEAIDNLR